MFTWVKSGKGRCIALLCYLTRLVGYSLHPDIIGALEDDSSCTFIRSLTLRQNV
jgi:hypothetical protein